MLFRTSLFVLLLAGTLTKSMLTHKYRKSYATTPLFQVDFADHKRLKTLLCEKKNNFFEDSSSAVTDNISKSISEIGKIRDDFTSHLHINGKEIVKVRTIVTRSTTLFIFILIEANWMFFIHSCILNIVDCPLFSHVIHGSIICVRDHKGSESHLYIRGGRSENRSNGVYKISLLIRRWFFYLFMLKPSTFMIFCLLCRELWVTYIFRDCMSLQRFLRSQPSHLLRLVDICSD